MADKQALQDSGGKLVELLAALRDGLQISEDLDEMTNFTMALISVADDIAEDWDSALLDIMAGISSRAADYRRTPETPENPA